MTSCKKNLVLIGLMGAGKTSIGLKLAEHLNMEFIDADEEIVKAAGCSIPDIFKIYGEPAFRDAEVRVIRRLLTNGPRVLATGGGAYMSPQIQAAIAQHGYSIWLKASLNVLVERTAKRSERPLLEAGEPRAVLRDLMHTRYPVYAQADLTVETDGESLNETLHAILNILKRQTPIIGDAKDE